MPIQAILDPLNSPGTQRGSQRMRIRLEAAGELEIGEQTAVTIHNLSASGILIETREMLDVGQKIRIDLPEVDPVPATVVWRSSGLFGCQFDLVLSRAVLSAVQLRNPLPADFDPLSLPQASRRHEPLAARISRLRRERGLNRAELADRTGLSKPSIWAWETGKAAPRTNNLILLADAFRISVAELRTGKSPDGLAKMDAEKSSSFDEPPMPTKDGEQSLQEIIQAARQVIAEAAGVKEEMVKILIEY